MTSRPSLRDATADAHAQLDVRVGGALEDRARYVAFLRGMHGFLSAAAAIDPRRDYARARAALAADLADLGVAPPPCLSMAPAAPATALGWRYVVAGASLGARVLLPRAQALGYDARRGARYLGVQAAGNDWRPLLAALDAAPDDMAEAVVAGARAAFALADHCMTESFETATA